MVSEKSGDLPWYAAGLSFQCTRCGRCCSGPAGHVWVSPAEIERLAEAMGLAQEDFERRFVRRVGLRHSLVEYPDGDCILLDPVQRICMLYEARPQQCRTWPFWPQNLKTIEAWEATCQQCPGAGKGGTYSLVQIEEIVRSHPAGELGISRGEGNAGG